MNSATKLPPTLEALRARRAEILWLAERHGASNVHVVGSVARDEATPDSDADLLMTIPSPRSVEAVQDLPN